MGDVVVDNGTFTKVLDVHNYVGDEVVDATGLKMIPGLVDIHFHGCKGADMCDGTKEALDIRLSMRSWGDEYMSGNHDDS